MIVLTFIVLIAMATTFNSPNKSSNSLFPLKEILMSSKPSRHSLPSTTALSINHKPLDPDLIQISPFRKLQKMEQVPKPGCANNQRFETMLTQSYQTFETETVSEIKPCPSQPCVCSRNNHGLQDDNTPRLIHLALCEKEESDNAAAHLELRKQLTDEYKWLRKQIVNMKINQVGTSRK